MWAWALDVGEVGEGDRDGAKIPDRSIGGWY
jgi:hypothetical protein